MNRNIVSSGELVSLYCGLSVCGLRFIVVGCALSCDVSWIVFPTVVSFYCNITFINILFFINVTIIVIVIYCYSYYCYCYYSYYYVTKSVVCKIPTQQVYFLLHMYGAYFQSG